MTVIKKTIWKDMDAVVLENNILKVVVLPGLGGKSASVFYKINGFELLPPVQNGVYKEPDENTPFEDCDASGFDDAFPTIVAAGGEQPGEEGRYTDHGEIWRSRMEVRILQEYVELTCKSGKNGYLYKKSISLHGSSVLYQYAIQNVSGKDFPCLWAMHALVRYEEDMELFYPKGVKSFLNTMDSPQLGKAGIRYPAKNQIYDFYTVPEASAVTMVKYYVDGKVSEGRCGYRYPGQNVQCEILYDEEKLPYLGFWLTAGGFRGDYNCAMEPSNGYYDGIDKARENGSLFVLKSGETLTFTIRIRLSPIADDIARGRSETKGEAG